MLSRKNKVYIASIILLFLVTLVGSNLSLINLLYFETKVYFKCYTSMEKSYIPDYSLINCNIDTLGQYILQTKSKYAIIAAAIRGDTKIIPYIEIIIKSANNQDKKLVEFCELTKYLAKNNIKFPQKIEKHKYLGKKNFSFFSDILNTVNKLSFSFNINAKTSIPLITQNYYKNQKLIYNKAEDKFKNRKFSEAFILNYLLANRNNVQAMYNIGAMLYHGEGVTQNYSTSFYYFFQAAKLGDDMAQFALAQMYREGLGCKKAHKKAEALYIKSARQNNIDSIKMLVETYIIQGEIKKAKQWLIIGSNLPGGNTDQFFKKRLHELSVNLERAEQP